MGTSVTFVSWTYGDIIRHVAPVFYCGPESIQPGRATDRRVLRTDRRSLESLLEPLIRFWDDSSVEKTASE